LHTSKKALAAVAAAAVLLVGAGAALGADGPAAKRQALRDAVAAKLGVSPEQLQAAFTAVLIERIDAKVAAGKLSAERAAKLKQAVADGKLGRLGKLRLGARPGKALAKARGGVVVEYLGIDPASIKAQLRAGKSLADVANATPGKSSAGLVAAIMERVSDRLGQAVEKGRLSEARKQELLVKAKERVDKLVAKRLPAHSS
jgi:hypothetical protein